MQVVGLKRPKELCDDMSRDIGYLQHLVSEYSLTNEEISILRPTSPNRDSQVLQNCIQFFASIRSSHDSLRIVRQSKENPYKTWKISDEGLKRLVPVVNDMPVYRSLQCTKTRVTYYLLANRLFGYRQNKTY